MRFICYKFVDIWNARAKECVNLYCELRIFRIVFPLCFDVGLLGSPVTRSEDAVFLSP